MKCNFVESYLRVAYVIVSHVEQQFVNIVVHFITGFTSLKKFMELRMKALELDLLSHKQSPVDYCVWTMDVKFVH